MKRFWMIWDCVTVAWLLVLSITFVGNFLVNYWGHGLPIAMFTFNDYGEAGVESIVFPMIIGVGVVTLIRMIRKVQWTRGVSRGETNVDASRE
ncbi:hypothetical protein LCGC14_1253600 [marine sediment metagenome]|uniref:Uncharacterized protein n=1 Tax=marine sediment metagenome TaxID=412755 RepID=A0A0F9L5P8_9ZZZZ